MAGLQKKVRECFSARRILSAMIFWGQIQNYMMRVSISILIVAMVKDPAKKAASNSTDVSDAANLTCSENRLNSSMMLAAAAASKIQGRHEGFDWDELVRGQILGIFSFGYMTTQIIGGRMSEYFGTKAVYGLGLFLSGITMFLTPVVAKADVYGFMALRVLLGIFEGVTFPSLYAITARWIPKEERNSFIARSFFGSVFGLVLTFPMCGALVEAFGWESAWYVIGGITTVWTVCWAFLVYDTPDKHPWISDSEKEYIKTELAKSVEEKPKPVPWKSILTSVPVWGMIITDCGNCVGIITLGAFGPSFLKFMLGVDIKTNGILSGLPMLSRYLGGLCFAAIADRLLVKETMSVTWVRRIFNSVCMIGPAIAMFMLAFSPPGLRCDVGYAITLLVIGMFFNGAISSGHFASPTDLSPNYAATVFGISNTISGSGLGFTVPVMVGAITKGNMTFAAWAIVFSIASVSYVITNFFYFFMISGEIQPWNYQQLENDEENEENKEFLGKSATKAVQEDTDNL